LRGPETPVRHTLSTGLPFATREVVESPYLFWRVTGPNGARSECLLVPGRRPAVVWYVNGHVKDVLEFDGLVEARRAALRLRRRATLQLNRPYPREVPAADSEPAEAC
jgi:hypothetical protein